MTSGGRPAPFPWAWFLAMVGCAAATGVAFDISLQLGIVLACVTVAVLICFMVWAVRQGRRRRAAGSKPDVPAIQRQMRRRLRWHLPLALLTVVACGVALATKDNKTPTWILVAPAVLVPAGLVLLWIFTEHLLPKAQRKQEGRSDDTSS